MSPRLHQKVVRCAFLGSDVASFGRTSSHLLASVSVDSHRNADKYSYIVDMRRYICTRGFSSRGFSAFPPGAGEKPPFGARSPHDMSLVDDQSISHRRNVTAEIRLAHPVVQQVLAEEYRG